MCAHFLKYVSRSAVPSSLPGNEYACLSGVTDPRVLGRRPGLVSGPSGSLPAGRPGAARRAQDREPLAFVLPLAPLLNDSRPRPTRFPASPALSPVSELPTHICKNALSSSRGRSRGDWRTADGPGAGGRRRHLFPSVDRRNSTGKRQWKPETGSPWEALSRDPWRG